METLRCPGNWSKLPFDLLISLFERLSFVDFHRAKMVCSHWYSCSKQTVPRKIESPWLMLFPQDGGCVLYNEEEDMFYKTERDFSETRILANCGKWFLVLDSKSNLYIVDVFNNEKRFDLPPLESILSDTYSLKRVGDMEFRWGVPGDHLVKAFANQLKGRLWVDEKAGELSLVWFFDAPAGYLGFYKKGNNHYSIIPVGDEVPKWINGLKDLVLCGYRLYILTTRSMVRVIDFSAELQELSGSNPYPMFSALLCDSSLVVTTAGEVLLVGSTISEGHRSFNVYKRDLNAEPDDFNPEHLEVDSLGDEAMLLDLGITVPANQTLGIKPNTIYFTRHDQIRDWITFDGYPDPIPYEVDICVFDMATKALKSFPALPNMKFKDARWLFPMA